MNIDHQMMNSICNTSRKHIELEVIEKESAVEILLSHLLYKGTAAGMGTICQLNYICMKIFAKYRMFGHLLSRKMC